MRFGSLITQEGPLLVAERDGHAHVLTSGARARTPGAQALGPGARADTPGAQAITPGMGGHTPGAYALTPSMRAVTELVEAVMQDQGRSLKVSETPIEDPRWGPPLLPGKIVAAGLNYRAHAGESGVEAPRQPLVFAKFPSCVTGPYDAIVLDPRLAQRVDWEVELGVVVGRRMRDVPAQRALDYVLGYTVANDVSARDVQFADGQWTRAKSFDTFCPLGPVIVTADELGLPDDLRLTTTVNGEVVQDDSTANMIFSVAELLAFCSRSFVLEPGDLLLTGTPPGCGEFMDPPRCLAPGDVVQAEIAGIGALRNPVVELPASRSSLAVETGGQP